MQPKVTCFGEVLLDVFPKHKKIGGAPLNVAVRLASYHNKVSIISSIGKDQNGQDVLAFLKTNQVTINYIQEHDSHGTGVVQVNLDEHGSASYEIKFPSAWDCIELTEESINLVKQSDAFIFGSLIARNKTSKHTLLKLLKYAEYKVFDVNLRTPYYTKDLLVELMNKASFIKFNDDELLEISQYLGSKHSSIEENIRYISNITNTEHICVTKGSKGAILLYDGTLYVNKGYKVEVVDTVGAGDSFLATLIDYLLKSKSPQLAIDKACAVGALVAKSEGANPKISSEEIQAFMDL